MPVKIDKEDIDMCIYVFNEYLREEYSAHYYDTTDKIKKAILKDENSIDSTPSKLIGMNEEIPNGYNYDHLERTYYPVYSVSDMNALQMFFSDYFAQNYMQEVKSNLNENFIVLMVHYKRWSRLWSS